MMKHWNAMTAEERMGRVRTMDGQGVSRGDQAYRLGISYMTLANFCSKNNLSAANDNRASKWRSLSDPERKEAVLAMRTDGATWQEVARELGTNRATLHAFVVANGLVERKIRVDGPPMVPADPVPEETWHALPGPEWPVTLLELEEGMCRWPVDDVPEATQQYFCGCQVHGTGESYCATHAHVSRHGMGSKQ